MASYRIVFKPSVRKDFRDLSKPIVERVLVRIDGLAENPRPRQSAKLTGTEGLYRLRVGDYRVIYAVDDETKTVMIHYARHRRDAYRAL